MWERVCFSPRSGQSRWGVSNLYDHHMGGSIRMVYSELVLFLPVLW